MTVLFHVIITGRTFGILSFPTIISGIFCICRGLLFHHTVGHRVLFERTSFSLNANIHEGLVARTPGVSAHRGGYPHNTSRGHGFFLSVEDENACAAQYYIHLLVLFVVVEEGYGGTWGQGAH